LAYPKGHNAAVRSRILAEARKAFNLRGYDGVKIDDVMSAAGLTRGAFYFHFASKALLYRESIAFVLDDHPVVRWVDNPGTERSGRQIVDAYLGARHLQDVADSCPLITHAAEAARSDEETQSVFARVLQALVNSISGDVDSENADGTTGLAVAAMCVGGLSLARGVGDPELAARILEAARSVTYSLAKWEDSHVAGASEMTSSIGH
jgi:AcrR family transcriptional regulator